MRGGSAELVHSESGDFGRGARWDNGNALPQALPVLYHLLVLHLLTATCSDSPPSATSTHCYILTFHCVLFPALLSMDGYLVICRGLPQLAPGLPTLTKAGKTFKKKTPGGKTNMFGVRLSSQREQTQSKEKRISRESPVFMHSPFILRNIDEQSQSLVAPYRSLQSIESRCMCAG